MCVTAAISSSANMLLTCYYEDVSKSLIECFWSLNPSNINHESDFVHEGTNTWGRPHTGSFTQDEVWKTERKVKYVLMLKPFVVQTSKLKPMICESVMRWMINEFRPMNPLRTSHTDSSPSWDKEQLSSLTSTSLILAPAAVHPTISHHALWFPSRLPPQLPPPLKL